MRRSIYWKLTVPFVALILLAMVILGAYVVSASRHTQIVRLQSQLINEAKLVSNISAPAFLAHADTASFEQIAKNVSTEIGSRVTLISTDGTVLGESDTDPSEMGNHSNRPEIVAALKSGSGVATRYSATLHENMLYAAVTVTGNNAVQGIARVALPLTAVTASVNSLATTIIVAVIIATVAVIIACAIVARLITLPIRRVTKAVEATASGKLGQQIPVRSDDEVGRLSHAFNTMSKSVKSAVQTISDERSRLAVVISGLTDGVVLTDSQGIVSLANPAVGKMFDLDEKRMTGKTLIEAIYDHEASRLLQKCLQSSSECNTLLETTIGRFLRVVATPLVEAETKGALVVFQDLTELRSLQTMRRELIGNISHELRTPLAGITAIVETLQSGAVDDPAEAKSFLDKLESEVERLNQMAAEITALSRIESGDVKMKLQPLDINGVIRDVITRLAPRADRQKVEVSLELPSDLPVVMADRERVEQVVLNIMDNAIKFTRAGGKIKVTTSHDDGTVRTEISDTGVGIAEEDLPHIFERFFKADRSRASSGTGLGLAISKHIIQAHKGTIWIRSKLGKGSTFGFSLPAAEITGP